MDGLRLTQAHYQDMQDEAENDLVAAFTSLEDDIKIILAQAGEEEWTAEHMLTAVDALFDADDEEYHGT